MAKGNAPAASGPKLTPQQLNAMQRLAVLQKAVEMKQQIFATTVAAPLTSGGLINVVPRNVGLVKKFIIEVSGTVNNTDAAVDATLTDFGVANLLSNVTFTDLNNNVRINTSGWHLTQLASAKRKQPYCGAFQVGALSTGQLDVQSMSEMAAAPYWPVVQAKPTVVHAAGAKTVRAQFEVPLAYSDDDLRGAIYGNVVNANMNLAIQINQAPFVATGADSTLAVYVGPAAASMALTNVTVTVYMVYLDQLPKDQKGTPVLPILDLSTVYELKVTNFTALAVNQEYPIPYANFRDFLSTFIVYNNNGTTRLATGADVSYFALQSANFTNLWKVDPLLAAQEAREILGADLPPGVYYFTHRRKPISTLQYGNMELIINPITAGAQAYALVGWEDFALVNTLTKAGSLAG